MIEQVSGNLTLADAEALVNTVNTVGVMGKGIALQFRQAYPANYKAYQRACDRGELQPGRMFVFETDKLTNPRYIINFPTKRHWRGKARMEDIEAGLEALIAEVRARRISSIAVPPLGCGNGGLDWDQVRLRIESAFAALPDVRVLLFAPQGAPVAEAMPVATNRPNITPARAVLVSLFDRYVMPGYRLTMLEMEKLAYFLQVTGELPRLKFEKGAYGPYAEALNHMLQRMEGHFIRGYGDRSRDASVCPLPEAVQEAEEYLRGHPESWERLDRVARLIKGFETPYGLELLATLHWLAEEDTSVRKDSERAIRAVQKWSARKHATFKPEHIQVAWERLRQQHWI